ncbi:TPA: hypothetical protein ACF2DS_003112 [Clostridium perfringens]|uniref:hypothetical protein n=1 Tax=Clostridium perfringens TaxID=1502 RepID=UPI000F532683|nr:hypothetical protein [Clostridium perfringens]EJT6342232.1 hypothetical protein [Clostridium perfringens]ELQ0173239.1 hypothetical protein [Clostridium perfringens]UBK97687.1 hypothetical protein KLF26_00090 [Clostridium perfringens]CAJ1610992.1 hypothetical protein CLO5623_02471 [Clostridium perfringens]BDC00304.1 hypothetical protein CP118TE_00130 [Clostridium perfringens E]
MDNCKYNHKCNCECNWDKYEDNCNNCNKCRKLEKISEELTRESAELNEAVEEKLEGVKYIQREIDELEERLECLRKKQKSLLCEAMELDEELDKTVFEAFKHLFATVECYKKCKNNERPERPEKPERPERPEKPGRPGCGCKYCCKDR